MSFRNVIKAAMAAALAIGIAGCSSAADTTSNEPIKVLSPTGAPALSTLGLEADNITVDYVEGQDVLISELAKSDGDYDLIIAPINLGVKSWNESQTYMLDGVVTWGNLFIVSDQEDWNTAGNTIAAFGESAVPGLVFNQLYPELECDVTYYPSVAEASQALLSGQVNTALLAQPIAAVAISKGAENGSEYTIQADLQTLWQQKEDTQQEGYPQAALFVKKDSIEKTASAVEQMETFLSDKDMTEIEKRIEEIGADKLGIPSAQIAIKTWDAQNISYKKAADVKEDIEKFLDVFNLTPADDLFVQ